MKTMQYKTEGFIVGDEHAFRSKLHDYRLAGPDKLHVLMDFDHTLTAGKVEGENVGTFQVLHEVMPAQMKAKHDALYNAYRPLEVSHQLTEETATEWYTKALDMIAGSGINMKTAKTEMLSHVKARSGSAELFRISHDAGIPVVVLSAGVKQMLDMILAEYSLDPDLVMATELQVKPDGLVNGWKKETLIHNLNKNEMGHAQMSSLRKDRPNTIVVGDELEDAWMVGGEAIRVRVFDPRKGEAVDEEQYYRQTFAGGYDLIVHDSLAPVARLVESIANPESRIQ